MRFFAIFDLSSIMWWVMFFTFSAGWKKTKEHRAQVKNVLDLILKLANMAWMANFIKSKKPAINLNLNKSGSLHIIWLCILPRVCHRSFWLYLFITVTMANSAFCFPVFAVLILQEFPYFWLGLCCNMFIYDLKSFVNL